MLNIFSLHGNYFQDNENRLTANFLFLLSELRKTFLPEFLRLLGIELKNPGGVEVIMQPGIALESRYCIPDAIVKCGDEFCLVIEAKIGTNPISADQLKMYATYLAESGAKQKRLVTITQIEEGLTFFEIRQNLVCDLLPRESFALFRWHQVLAALRSSVGLEREEQLVIRRSVEKGRSVDYTKRIVSLFLEEVEQSMYQKIVVDSVPAGELADIRVTTQKPWFMEVALRHRVWFPDGTLEYGLKPTRWVAYYETADCTGNPSHISHLARNRVFWNRITFDDATTIPELRQLFAHTSVREKIRSWFHENEQKPFHLVLTEQPVKLREPIPLNGSRRARALTKKIFPAERFFNARTVDALFDGDTA